MDLEILEKQYDRCLSQLRIEIKEFYWLYNFFFAIESAIVGALLLGRIDQSYILESTILGIIIAGLWFLICFKQKKWKDVWIRKLKVLEGVIGLEKNRLWDDVPKENYKIFGAGGLIKTMLALPILFIFFNLWILLTQSVIIFVFAIY